MSHFAAAPIKLMSLSSLTAPFSQTLKNPANDSPILPTKLDEVLDGASSAGVSTESSAACVVAGSAGSSSPGASAAG